MERVKRTAEYTTMLSTIVEINNNAVGLLQQNDFQAALDEFVQAITWIRSEENTFLGDDQNDVGLPLSTETCLYVTESVPSSDDASCSRPLDTGAGRCHDQYDRIFLIVPNDGGEDDEIVEDEPRLPGQNERRLITCGLLFNIAMCYHRKAMCTYKLDADSLFQKALQVYNVIPSFCAETSDASARIPPDDSLLIVFLGVWANCTYIYSRLHQHRQSLACRENLRRVFLRISASSNISKEEYGFFAVNVVTNQSLCLKLAPAA
uniref:Uncharacterized protein n=1 Tax=Phaeodactylum tricornutum TaxID=2850 RepID=A0A8J9X1Z8_PHATR